MAVLSTIIYTQTDEAPALATYSLLPILKAYAHAADVEIETRNISLASRILTHFSEFLLPEQRVNDALSDLGKLAQKPEANIIKLPNISASLPQLKSAIKELQDKGYNLPDYPEEPETEAEVDAKSRYDKVKGSAVNPVLREGNSDRRAPGPVKQYAKNHPHSMGAWDGDSKTHVSHMSDGDFFASEKSITLEAATEVRIEHRTVDGKRLLLKTAIAILPGEIIDAAVMSKKALKTFITETIEDAKSQNILMSLHLKATMMKVSDPIIFGHFVAVYYSAVFEKHATIFDEMGIDQNNGIGDVYAKIKFLPQPQQDEIISDIEACYEYRPKLAMVNSDKGITNLHVPSDIIVDASMPAAIRSSGKMWGPNGNLRDIKAIIPDRCYAGIYQEIINFCKQNGAFDPTTMGSVPNVGLMAQKAEEYGSHDKTFEIKADGIVQIIDADDHVLLEHKVKTGDIWRMCQVKDAPIQDWVKLAVKRIRATSTPAVFWLDPQRAHDRQVIKKVNTYLDELSTEDMDIQILSPIAAMRITLERLKNGQDTISVTGNVLRDYLTDLFPILELGTSAKMLSIVPLMNGGGLFETGAGGSAPKHVQQFIQEGHLRWDSLGEFLALSVSLEHLSETNSNPKAKILASTLDRSIVQFLEKNKSPSRLVNEIDTRGSHFYLALYWAEALAQQYDDLALQGTFKIVAEQLLSNEDKITTELVAVQGRSYELGGYYQLNDNLVTAVMRPSKTLNAIIDSLPT